MSQVAHDRLLLGRAAVLSPSEAGRLLPVERVKAKAWLEEMGLVRILCGKEVVIWGDVLDALRAVGGEIRLASPKGPPEGLRLAALD